jgi:hypothetical protein
MTIAELRQLSSDAQWAGSFIICASCLPLFRDRKVYVKAVFFYAMSSILFQAGQQIAILFFHNVGVNQIGNGFVFFEAVLLSVMYWYVTETPLFRKGVLIVAGAYVVFYFVCILFFPANSHSSIRFGREIILVLFSLAYFYYLLKKMPEDDLLKLPMFWINTASLIFFSGTSFLSIMVNYLVNVLGDNLDYFWTFRNFFRFVFCLVITYACWLDWRQVKKGLNKNLQT